MIYKISVFFCFIFAIVGVTIFAQSENNSSNPPEVPILGTQLQKITSAIDGQKYVLYVNLPRNYSDTTKKFPLFMFSTVNGISPWFKHFTVSNIMTALFQLLLLWA